MSNVDYYCFHLPLHCIIVNQLSDKLRTKIRFKVQTHLNKDLIDHDSAAEPFMACAAVCLDSNLVLKCLPFYTQLCDCWSMLE